MLRAEADAMIHALQTAMLIVFPALVIAGGAIDAVTYRIPNWISLALLAGFGAAAAAAGLPLPLVLSSLGAGAAALALAVLFFALRWIGGGDAKLFAAAGLWLGWSALLPFVVVVCLAGGALAGLLLVLRSVWVRPLAILGPAWVARLASPGEGVPYGVAIAIGALVAFPACPLAKALGAPL